MLPFHTAFDGVPMLEVTGVDFAIGIGIAVTVFVFFLAVEKMRDKL